MSLGVFTRPVKEGRITSGFGLRIDPMDRSHAQEHKGIDFGVKKGTEVGSIADGKIIAVGHSENGGNFVTVQHNDPRLCSTYMHLSEAKVRVGQTVRSGETIALSGNTGKRTTAAHLHVQVTLDGVKVDPTPYLGLTQSKTEIKLPACNRNSMAAQVRQENQRALEGPELKSFLHSATTNSGDSPHLMITESKNREAHQWLRTVMEKWLESKGDANPQRAQVDSVDSLIREFQRFNPPLVVDGVAGPRTLYMITNFIAGSSDPALADYKDLNVWPDRVPAGDNAALQAWLSQSDGSPTRYNSDGTVSKGYSYDATGPLPPALQLSPDSKADCAKVEHYINKFWRERRGDGKQIPCTAKEFAPRLIRWCNQNKRDISLVIAQGVAESSFGMCGRGAWDNTANMMNYGNDDSGNNRGCGSRAPDRHAPSSNDPEVVMNDLIAGLDFWSAKMARNYFTPGQAFTAENYIDVNHCQNRNKDDYCSTPGYADRLRQSVSDVRKALGQPEVNSPSALKPGELPATPGVNSGNFQAADGSRVRYGASYNLQGHGGIDHQPKTTIVLHDTAGGTLDGAISTLRINKLAYQFLINTDGTVIRGTENPGVVAYHASNANIGTIGISFVGMKSTLVQQQAALDLIAQLKGQYPIKYVTGHKHVFLKEGIRSDRSDPEGFDTTLFNKFASAAGLNYIGDVHGTANNSAIF